MPDGSSSAAPVTTPGPSDFNSNRIHRTGANFGTNESECEWSDFGTRNRCLLSARTGRSSHTTLGSRIRARGFLRQGPAGNALLAAGCVYKTTNPDALAIHDFLRFQIEDHHTGDAVAISGS